MSVDHNCIILYRLNRGHFRRYGIMQFSNSRSEGVGLHNTAMNTCYIVHTLYGAVHSPRRDFTCCIM